MKLRAIPFYIVDKPYCWWSNEDLDENIRFLKSIDEDYFLYSANLYVKSTDVNKEFSYLGIRHFNFLAVETMLSMIFNIFQSPQAVMAYINTLSNENIREIHFHLSNKRSLKNIHDIASSYKDISRLIFKTLYESTDEVEDKSTNYAKMWERMAEDFVRSSQEYNSIQHSLRVSGGAAKLYLIPEDSSGMPPIEDEVWKSWIHNDSDVFGSGFFSKLRAKSNSRNIGFQYSTINWDPVDAFNSVQACVMSIKLLKSYYKKIFTDDSNYSHPLIDDHGFGMPWQNGVKLINIDLNLPNLPQEDKEILTNEQIEAYCKKIYGEHY